MFICVFFLYNLFSFFFFFFQAEDGIRDLTVTGVQTCALPISRGRPTCAGSRRSCLRSGRPFGASRRPETSSGGSAFHVTSSTHTPQKSRFDAGQSRLPFKGPA